jgi:hypothetical protein
MARVVVDRAILRSTAVHWEPSDSWGTAAWGTETGDSSRAAASQGTADSSWEESIRLAVAVQGQGLAVAFVQQPVVPPLGQLHRLLPLQFQL